MRSFTRVPMLRLWGRRSDLLINSTWEAVKRGSVSTALCFPLAARESTRNPLNFDFLRNFKYKTEGLSLYDTKVQGLCRTDERTGKQKKIDEWLPITSSRNATWWYSAFHNVTAMVGAGVLSLPYAMSELGWGPGIAVLIISWIITLYTLWEMVEMHEMVPGRRFDRYHELGQYAFGEKLGLYIVVPQQLIVEVGVCIVYMVTGGKSLKKFHDTVCEDCKDIKLTYFIMIFASVHFALSQLPNFNSIAGVSLAAAVMSLSYSTIAWGASVDKGKQPNVSYGYKRHPNDSTADIVFNFFSALGDVAFAYAGHNVVLEIQATIPSSPAKPSKKPMWKGVVVAYIIVALCYFPVALVGYWAFGNSVEDNILLSLRKPNWLIAMANLMVVIHVIGSYQIYAMPVFDMMETVLVKKLHFPPGLPLRLIARSGYVAFTMFLGITFPFFSGLLAFFGGFAFAPTTYYVSHPTTAFYLLPSFSHKYSQSNSFEAWPFVAMTKTIHYVYNNFERSDGILILLMLHFGDMLILQPPYFVPDEEWVHLHLQNRASMLFRRMNMLPCIMWLAIYKPRKFSFSWIANWVGHLKITSPFLLCVFALLLIDFPELVLTEFCFWYFHSSDLHHRGSVTDGCFKGNSAEQNQLVSSTQGGYYTLLSGPSLLVDMKLSVCVCLGPLDGPSSTFLPCIPSTTI
ncbi:Lysine histidine transporter 1 [Asimina triloba]